MTLNIFDLDDTLIASAGPEIAKSLMDCKLPLDLSLKDLEKNRYLWWDHPISLSMDVFDYKINTRIHKEYDKYAHRDNTSNIIITHRIPELIPSIENIMKQNDMRFDDIFCGSRTNLTKVDILKKYMLDNQGIVHIRIYEDSIYELKQYELFLKTIDIQVDYYFVNTRYIFKLKDVNLDLSDCDYLFDSSFY